MTDHEYSPPAFALSRAEFSEATCCLSVPDNIDLYETAVNWWQKYHLAERDKDHQTTNTQRLIALESAAKKSEALFQALEAIDTQTFERLALECQISSHRELQKQGYDTPGKFTVNLRNLANSLPEVSEAIAGYAEILKQQGRSNRKPQYAGLHAIGSEVRYAWEKFASVAFRPYFDEINGNVPANETAKYLAAIVQGIDPKLSNTAISNFFGRGILERDKKQKDQLQVSHFIIKRNPQ